VLFRLALTLLAAFGLASCKPGDGGAGCTVDNCKAAMDQCHVEPDTDPYAYCLMARAPVSEDEAERTQVAMGECVKACQRTQAGETFACIGQNAGQCYSTDAGVQGHFSQDGLNAVLDKCLSGGGGHPGDESCFKTCRDAFRTCVLADFPSSGLPKCPVDTMDACLTCANQCADTYNSCQNACPAAK
jgi:hypothetical protein